VFVGVGFGAPYWGWGWGWPGYYYPYGYSAYYPYYDYPYGYDSGYSGTYIEQGAPAAAPPARGEYSPAPSQYSYYCPDPAGFYPQVPTCAKGWLRVVPPSAPGPTGPGAY
jgi:hypothetical protein